MKKKMLLVALAAAAGIVVYWILGSLEHQTRVVSALLVVAAVLWLTEALALHITSLLMAFLLIWVGGFASKTVFASFFDPVVVLFLGGFTLAAAWSKFAIDQFIASRIFRFTGKSTWRVVLALMAVTAFLSMWISNTAAAALMIPIAVTMLKQSKVDIKDGLWRIMPLAVAHSATLGGLVTIIGSPPNAIAKKYLTDLAVGIDFASWIGYMAPIALVIGLVVVAVLFVVFPSRVRELELPKTKELILSRGGYAVLALTAVTALLWVIGNRIGLNEYVVGLIPVIVLFGSELLEGDDFKRLNWDVLILFGGGIALGEAVKAAQVDVLIAGQLEGLLGQLPTLGLYMAVTAVGVLMTVVASNTGAAVLMMPIVAGIAKQLGIDPLPLILLTTCGVSLDFILPIGTPPSALAYSTGHIKTAQMVKSGLLITIFVITVPAVLVALML